MAFTHSHQWKPSPMHSTDSDKLTWQDKRAWTATAAGFNTPKFCAATAAILIFLLAPLPVWSGNAAYNKAVADYSAGNYGQAASELEALKAAYPTNLLVRYYLGLTRQALGHFEKARAEYQWVASNGDDRLRQMALQGIKRMSATKSYVPSTSGSKAPGPGDYIPPFASSSGSGSSSGSNSGSTSSAGGQQNRSKVRTILCFTAPWCSTCQRFLPVYEATKSQFNDVSFESVDFDSNPDMKSKYGVARTPHIVFLDSGGKVLFSRAGAPFTVDQFKNLIQNYH